MVCFENSLMRAGLRTVLEAESEITVVAEASNCEEMVQGIDQHRPDVLIMPQVFTGLSAVRGSTKDGGADLVVLVDSVDPTVLSALIRTDARVLVHCDASHNDLVDAVRAAAVGADFVSAQLVGALMQLVRDMPVDRGSVDIVSSRLTCREVEVLQLLVQGMTNGEIAGALNLSVKTVKFHVSNLLAKTDTRTRTGLTASVLK